MNALVNRLAAAAGEKYQPNGGCGSSQFDTETFARLLVEAFLEEARKEANFITTEKSADYFINTVRKNLGFERGIE